jgi:hypothetical protein
MVVALTVIVCAASPMTTIPVGPCIIRRAAGTRWIVRRQWLASFMRDFTLEQLDQYLRLDCAK